MEDVSFKNGHIYCDLDEIDLSGDNVELDLYSTYDLYKKMDKYYNQQCVVRHWRQKTMESGRWVEDVIKIKDAVFMMKENLIEQASYKPL